jgi:hypothetical protein
MLRFGSKNLTEWDQRRLKQILSEKVARQVDPSEWQITGFTAPVVSTLSTKTSPSGSLFFDAYRTYMDPSTGMIGKTLLIFNTPTGADAANGINGVYLDPADVKERIVIQSSYVPGPKAKDVEAAGEMGQTQYIKIWSSKQATRNFELADKTAVLKAEGMTEFQNASISLLRDKQTGNEIMDPTAGYVRAGGEYSIGTDFAVRQSGQIIGYAPIAFDTNAVHKTEGWNTVLVSKGFPEKNAW